jgi:hypothetical protein
MTGNERLVVARGRAKAERDQPSTPGGACDAPAFEIHRRMKEENPPFVQLFLHPLYR